MSTKMWKQKWLVFSVIVSILLIQKQSKAQDSPAWRDGNYA